MCRWTNHFLFSFSIAGLLLAAMPSSASNDSRDKLARIFRYEMLGARIAYLESFVGPAMRINDDKSRQYEVGGCNVTIDSDGTLITGFRLELTPSCTFDVRKIVGLELPTANAITFGRFAQNAPDSKFLSSCIYLCGNAADPEVQLYWQGPHASNFLEVVVGTQVVSIPAIEATERIRKEMTWGESGDYVLWTKFNCDKKYDRFAANSLRDVPISFIEIGYHVDPHLGCAEP